MLAAIDATECRLAVGTYSYFYLLLSRRSGLTSGQAGRGIQKQNLRAARVTLLILFSCLACWLPATTTHLLVCPTGCPLHPSSLPPPHRFLLHAAINLLVIVKEFGIHMDGMEATTGNVLTCANAVPCSHCFVVKPSYIHVYVLYGSHY